MNCIGFSSTIWEKLFKDFYYQAKKLKDMYQ